MSFDILSPTLLPIASGGSMHLPDFLSFFSHSEKVLYWKPIVFTTIVSALFSIAALVVYRKREILPGPFQNMMEMMFEGMYEFVQSVLGKDARRYTPFLGTLFFYILFNNLMGIIPGGFSPSTSIYVTASLALMVFFYTQYIAFTRLGARKYFDHLLGEPRDVTGWILVIILLPIHLIGEIVKPFSLAVRLFGNITGEDILIAAFVTLSVGALSIMDVGLIPMNVPFIFLGLLLSTVQAFVFTLLSTIYILMMLPHEEEH